MISPVTLDLFAKEAIASVLTNFFQFDALTQMVLVDLVNTLTSQKWTQMMMGPFFAQLFKTQRGLHS